MLLYYLIPIDLNSMKSVGISTAGSIEGANHIFNDKEDELAKLITKYVSGMFD